MDQFGTVKPYIIHKSESHKLHLAFLVKASTTIYQGTPVKLTSTGDVEPAAAGENPLNIIGYAIKTVTSSATVQNEITIAMKGHMVVKALAKEIAVPGPCKYDSYDTTEEQPVFSMATVTASNNVGFNLTVALAANDPIYVVLN